MLILKKYFLNRDNSKFVPIIVHLKSVNKLEMMTTDIPCQYKYQKMAQDARE